MGLKESIVVSFHTTRLVICNILLPFVDCLTDVVSGIKHFMRGNPIWGALTLLLTLVPTVLGTWLMEIKINMDNVPSWVWWDEGGLLFIESDRAIGYLEPTVLGNVLLHFPFVNVATQAFYTQHLARLKQAIQATNDNPEESNNILQDQFDRLSSDLLEFKIYEAFGESAPQFVLQLTLMLKLRGALENSDSTATMWDNLSLQLLSKGVFPGLALIQLLTSWLSVLFSCSGLTNGLKLVLHGTEKTPNQKLLFTLATLLMNAFVMTPRLLAIPVVLSTVSLSKPFALLIVAIGISAHFIGSELIFGFYALLPKNVPQYQVKQYLLGLITSLITPCVVVNPWEHFFFMSGIVSATGQSITLAFVLITLHLQPELLDISPNDTTNYWYICSILILWIPLTSLVTHGMALFLQNVNIDIYFMSCCEKNDIEVLKSILEKNATRVNLNKVGPNGNTALCSAAEFDNFEVCRVLLNHGADVNIKNNNGRTALQMIVFPSMFTQLSSFRKNFPLHKRAESCDRLEMIRELIGYGADVNTGANSGSTALHAAAAANSESIIKELISEGAEVNVQDQLGITPLHIAARHDLKTVNELIKNGAMVQVADNRGHTPLHEAALRKSVSNIVKLLDEGADANTRNDSGATPLHRAAIMGHIDSVKELFNRGADKSITDTEGRTALDIAGEEGHVDIANYLERVLEKSNASLFNDDYKKMNHILKTLLKAKIYKLKIVDSRRHYFLNEDSKS